MFFSLVAYGELDESGNFHDEAGYSEHSQADAAHARAGGLGVGCSSGKHRKTMSTHFGSD